MLQRDSIGRYRRWQDARRRSDGSPRAEGRQIAGRRAGARPRPCGGFRGLAIASLRDDAGRERVRPAGQGRAGAATRRRSSNAEDRSPARALPGGRALPRGPSRGRDLETTRVACRSTGRVLLARGDFEAACTCSSGRADLEADAERAEIEWSLSQGAILWNDFASAHDYAADAVRDGYGLVPGFVDFLGAMPTSRRTRARPWANRTRPPISTCRASSCPDSGTVNDCRPPRSSTPARCTPS